MKSRVLILCGGSLIQNYTSTRSLIYYTRICREAAMAGCRIMIWGGGIGPVNGKNGLKYEKELLSLVTSAGLRDPESFKEALSFRKEGDFYLSADPVLTWPIEKAGGPGKYFSVCPRRLLHRRDSRRLYRALSRAVPAIAEKTGAQPEFIALAPEDGKICRKLLKKCGGKFLPCTNTYDTLKELKSARFCISVRLHSAVFSAMSAVPFVSISYDPKVRRFAEQAGAPCLELEGLTAEKIIAAIPTVSPASAVADSMKRMKDRAAADISSFLKLYNYSEEVKDNDE